MPQAKKKTETTETPDTAVGEKNNILSAQELVEMHAHLHANSEAGEKLAAEAERIAAYQLKDESADLLSSELALIAKQVATSTAGVRALIPEAK